MGFEIIILAFSIILSKLEIFTWHNRVGFRKMVLLQSSSAVVKTFLFSSFGISTENLKDDVARNIY